MAEIASSNPAITIAFPTDPVLNRTGQFNKLQREGQKFKLLNTTTKQTKELTDKQLIRAFSLVVIPLMA